MEFDAETLKKHIPPYLTDESQRILFSNLSALHAKQSIGLILSDRDNEFQNDMLQGDGWRGFELYSFDENKIVSVFGIVISNSCDISPKNERDKPTRITFSPLVKLAAYQQVLEKSNLESQRVEDKIRSIRHQETSNIFFIPAGGSLEEDYIVRLDEIYSIPVKYYQKHPDRQKFFTFIKAVIVPIYSLLLY